MTDRLVPIGAMLATVQQELVTLHGLSLDAQAMMGTVLRDTVLDAEDWNRAQSLDLITQRLQCLSALTRALVGAAEARWLVDPVEAVKEVTLSDMERRLVGAAAECPPTDAIELF